MPLPPPFSGTEIKPDPKNGSGVIDMVPPSIELLNDALTEGKNVLRVRIQDGSDIDKCKVIYARESANKTVDCVWDSGNFYKALVAAQLSAVGQKMEIYVRDSNGNSRTSFYLVPVDDRVTSFFSFFKI